MKTSIAALVLAVLASFSPASIARAQTAPGDGTNPSSGGPTLISPAEFVRGVQEGTLAPITRDVLSAQARKRRTREAHSRTRVEKFLRNHPELTDLDQLVHASPDLEDPALSHASGGDFNLTFVDNLGDTQQVETLGDAFKWNSVAEAIRSAQDPDTQLNLYTRLYDAIPPTLEVGNVTPPAELKGASLRAIRGALQGLVTTLDPILAKLPPPIDEIGPAPASCEGDIGASTTPNVNQAGGALGDQARNVCSPSPDGIIGNFTFPDSPYLTCVKSQGHRGTCHIFATLSGVEESIAFQTGKHVNLSEQELTEFENGSWDPSFFSDGGGAISDLGDAASHGYHFAYEKQWDYNASPSRDKSTFKHSCDGYPNSETACSNTSPQAPAVCADFFLGTICAVNVVKAAGAHPPYTSNGATSIYFPGTLDLTVLMMQVGLALNIPVVMAFDVSDEFSNPTNGYVTYSSSDVLTDGGGHVVHVIGYVSNEQLAKQVPSAPPGAGGGYFVIKNSWGACAGDAGYYYMPVKYFKKRTHGVAYVSPIGF